MFYLGKLIIPDFCDSAPIEYRGVDYTMGVGTNGLPHDFMDVRVSPPQVRLYLFPLFFIISDLF
jgi:hypothetical protein